MKDWMIILIFVVITSIFGVTKVVLSKKLAGDSQEMPSQHKIIKKESP